jgi:very-short-patch-repair endonuclease
MKHTYNDASLKIKRKGLRTNIPKPEQVLWYYIRNKQLKGYKFRRQYSVNNFILDFYCPQLRLALEIDGDSHYNAYSAQYDEERTKKLEDLNISVLRFPNAEIMQNIEGVLEAISKYLP